MKNKNQKIKKIQKRCKLYTNFCNQLEHKALQAFYCKLRFTLLISCLSLYKKK